MSLAPYLDTHKAIIGTSGAGKSTTAREEVEQLLNDNRHVCIIDPTGVWWGLRSAADGESPGFDIAVFGGEHGDVPISAGQGGIVGKIIAGGLSAVVDVSDMSSADQRFFVLEMLSAIRKHRERGNFHLIVDEADEFAAQTSRDSIGFQCEEALVWTAKRGRFFGYVLTIITQRTADMSWSVLSQCVTMVVHHLMAPQDIAVVDKYLKANADKETRTKVLTSIPNLQTGHRWIYSPKLKVLEVGLTPRPTTFDSSATPLPGETVNEPKLLAQIDLGEIREMLAPLKPEYPSFEDVEHARITNDGLAEEIEILQTRLREAEEQRNAAQADAHHWRSLAVARKGQLDRIALITFEKMIGEDRDPTEDFVTLEFQSYDPVPAPAFYRDSKRVHEVGEIKFHEEEPAKPGDVTEPLPPAEPMHVPGTGTIPPRWQKILDAIAWGQMLLKMEAVDRSTIAWVNGNSPKSSGFQNDLGAMRTRGLVRYPSGGVVSLTEEGARLANKPKSAPTKAQLFDVVKSSLEPRFCKILDTVYGYKTASRATIAEHLSLSPNSSGFQNDLGKLRTLGLIDYPKPGYVTLGSVLA